MSFPKKRELPEGTYQVAYRLALRPSEVQCKAFAKTFGCVRFIWNKMLEDLRKGLYTTPASYKPEFEWLKEVDCLALCNAQLNLRRAKNPKFKKKGENQSYTTNNKNGTIRFEGEGKYRKIRLPKIGFVDVIVHREIQGEIRSTTVSRDATGQYFVSVLCDQVIEKLPSTGKNVGLDLGLGHLAVQSDGKKIRNPKHLNKSQKKLEKAQRKLSKRKKGGKNYQKQREKVAKIHRKTKNQRNDFLHKTTTEIVKNHDVIVIEDLSTKNMMKNRKLARSIGDASWGKIRNMLEYKSKRYGRELVVVDRFFPSSKLCHCCGHKMKSMPLSVREWTCPHCNTKHDRDVNAAMNIQARGLSTLGLAICGGLSHVNRRNCGWLTCLPQEVLPRKPPPQAPRALRPRARWGSVHYRSKPQSESIPIPQP